MDPEETSNHVSYVLALHNESRQCYDAAKLFNISEERQRGSYAYLPGIT